MLRLSHLSRLDLAAQTTRMAGSAALSGDVVQYAQQQERSSGLPRVPVCSCQLLVRKMHGPGSEGALVCGESLA